MADLASRDGKPPASGGQDDVVRFWDVATGSDWAISQAGGGALKGLAFSTDGQALGLGRRRGRP
jgi:hypothetical protein